MDEATARRLSSLTGQFYEQVSSSFSQTRQHPWQGWERVLDVVGMSAHGDTPYRVLDLACGNLRFEHFLGTRAGCGEEGALAENSGQPLVVALALDSCDPLVREGDTGIPGVQVRFRHLDVTEEMLLGHDLGAGIGESGIDLAVCFGFMHHLALPQHRTQVLRALVESVVPGGFVAVSLWQLSRSPRLLAKAQKSTARASSQLGLDGLGSGDYLLGWQDRADVWRYCHDFSEPEVDELASSVASQAVEVARFSADGATGNLNRYLVLKVN